MSLAIGGYNSIARYSNDVILEMYPKRKATLQVGTYKRENDYHAEQQETQGHSGAAASQAWRFLIIEVIHHHAVEHEVLRIPRVEVHGRTAATTPLAAMGRAKRSRLSIVFV